MSGKVYLVGAGPGDPALLTARALELIADADVILYDRLIAAAALAGARADAELLFVGKEGGGASVPQEQTEALMLERARSGLRVVRLKGGDPFVFGRGGEEALALHAQGIPFEVVPGVTAGVAASAYAGIPVTHRGMASAVALVTGQTREDDDERAPDWQALAAFPGTLVLYMGVRRLEEIAAALLAGGRPGSEPAAVVEAGTLPGQRVVEGTLETIAARAREAGVSSPAITVVGQVASLAGELSWLGARPLLGVRVAVTRARAQASSLAQRLEALGASVVQAPVIRVRALADQEAEPLDPSPYDLICLTSANGVGALFERLAAGGRDARSLAGARVAAIGPGTARALAEHGIAADVVGARFVAESLVEALAEIPVERVLIARAREARDVLPDALRERGAHVDVVALYETIAEELPEHIVRALQTVDYLLFASSSAVRFFLEAVGEQGVPPSARVVSIGPVTSSTLQERGIEPDVEAQRHDVEGLVEALLADAAARKGSRDARR